jgi:putative PEP-CTERM system integral membrane protein
MHLKLPQGAVITDLWLSEDNTKRYAATVSPRGAAQRVYKEIVKRGADPALVEQVGPQLYRMRVFPIPTNDSRSGNKRVMHMWLSLRVLRQSENSWKLPLLTEKRNLYWDQSTKFTVNGVKGKKDHDWLPEKVPARYSSVPMETMIAKVGNQTVEMRPYDGTPLKFSCDLDVIIDTSFSMRSKRVAILQAHSEIERFCPTSEGVNRPNYYFWNQGLEKMDGSFAELLNQREFWGAFGSEVLAESLAAHSATIASTSRDVLVLTDKTIFRETDKTSSRATSSEPLNRPIWFFMVDHLYPRSVNDSLLKRLYETGGNIDGDLENIFAEMAQREFRNSHPDVIDIDGRYIWRLRASEGGPQGVSGRTGEPLLIHKFITHAIKLGFTKDVEDLDQLQSMALQSHIVSPYSSMIVLVDDAQRKMLEQAEGQSDRFDRDVETGKELLTAPNAPLHQVTAVPEPEEWALTEEWALILAVMAFLLFHVYRKGFNVRWIYGTIYR